MTPRYIADYGKRKFHVYDRLKDKIIDNISFDEFKLDGMSDPF